MITLDYLCEKFINKKQCARCRRPNSITRSGLPVCEPCSQALAGNKVGIIPCTLCKWGFLGVMGEETCPTCVRETELVLTTAIQDGLLNPNKIIRTIALCIMCGRVFDGYLMARIQSAAKCQVCARKTGVCSICGRCGNRSSTCYECLRAYMEIRGAKEDWLMIPRQLALLLPTTRRNGIAPAFDPVYIGPASQPEPKPMIETSATAEVIRSFDLKEF